MHTHLMPLVRAVLAALFVLACFPSCTHETRSTNTVTTSGTVGAPSDPLPSWSDGPAKQAILHFVADVTDPKSQSFVAREARIAAFDNDGTLWVEKPLPVQGMFALDRVRALAADHPEWRSTQPFEAILEGDRAKLEDMDAHDALAILRASESGVSQPDFARYAGAWLSSATHPRFHVLYTDLVYRPMLELLAYLRANGFLTYLCSGGTVDFMRVFADKSYGIPTPQVIGTSLVTEVSTEDGRPALMLTSEVVVPVNDGAGKPVNLSRSLGTMPILVAGNSDGDLPMMQFSAGQPGAHLELLVHHDDPKREYAYDQGAERALHAAQVNHWTIVSMREDFVHLFPNATQ